jgi:hypothetical protein
LPEPMSPQGPASDWEVLRRELRGRTARPVSSVPFISYFIVSVVILGGLGIWVELVRFSVFSDRQCLSGLMTALLTFFPAVMGSSTSHLILSSSDNKILRSFGLLLFVASFAVAIFIAVISPPYPVTSLVIGVVLSLLGLWGWWIANANDPALQNDPPVDAPTGGSPERALTGQIGDFRV